MIRGEHDQRFVEESATLQKRQKISHHAIFVRHFGGITGFAVTQARILREVVGQVQVVQMEK